MQDGIFPGRGGHCPDLWKVSARSASRVVRRCKISPKSNQTAFCCGRLGVETLSQSKTSK
eukprot:250828-Prymnesium_polylepis.1